MSLRERMRVKARATATHSLRIEDDTAAQDELTAAQASGDADRITQAKAAVDACYEPLRITALPPADVEALIAAHPSTDGKGAWNPPTFIPALFAACVEGDATEDDWAEWTTKGPMTQGEVAALFDKVWGVNYRTPPGPSLGKDSTPNRS